MPAEQIGYVVMWSGLPQLVLFPAMPFLMKQFDPRILVVIGTLLFASSCFINVKFQLTGVVWAVAANAANAIVAAMERPDKGRET